MLILCYVYFVQALEKNHEENKEEEFVLKESGEENNNGDKEQGFIKESLMKHACNSFQKNA